MTSSNVDIQRTPSLLHSLPWVLGWASMTVMGPLMLIKVIYRAFNIIMNSFISQDRQLLGKTVFITGASSGLGEAIAHELYKRGCRLILASRDTVKLNKLKDTLINSYKLPELRVPVVVHLDLEDLNKIPEVVSEVMSSIGQVDVLINNAGVSYRGDIKSTDISVHIRLMVINYFGQVALTKALLPSMEAHGQGHIIGISSIQGKLALPFRSCYTASKHAFQGFLDCLRAEVASSNINVSVISPGYIATNLSKNALVGDGSKYNKVDESTASGMTPQYVAKQVVKCMINKDPDILLCPSHHKLIVYLRLLAPCIYRTLMKWRAIKHYNSSKEISKDK